MDQDQQSRWRPTRRQVQWFVGIVVTLVVATIVLGYVLEWEWTGLVKDKAYTKRTLWDWLQLLIIPAVLAGVGLWFNRQQRAQELEIADRRAQEEALQTYLDQMSAMLIPSKDQPTLYVDPPPPSLKTVARARTLTVLSRLDGDRKARVVQFLHESGLIAQGRPVLALGGADLSEASLRGADLSRADLSEADLSGAHLSYAKLDRANLFNVDLHQANLSYAHLSRADLAGADLSRANLSGAHLYVTNLSYANLHGSNLNGAALGGARLLYADLSDADLSGITGRPGESEEMLEQLLEHLEQAARSLERTTMPDGQRYEDWLKSKGRRVDGENSAS